MSNDKKGKKANKSSSLDRLFHDFLCKFRDDKKLIVVMMEDFCEIGWKQHELFNFQDVSQHLKFSPFWYFNGFFCARINNTLNYKVIRWSLVCFWFGQTKTVIDEKWKLLVFCSERSLETSKERRERGKGIRVNSGFETKIPKIWIEKSDHLRQV